MMNMAREKLHFFVIDDDEDFLKLIETLLKEAGYCVTAYTSSTEALKGILEGQPDCVISDLSLPSLGGMELFEQIRKEKNIKQPTFIILTSRQYGYDINYAEKMGVNGYLQKPIDVTTFVDEILEIVSNRMLVQFWGVRGTLPVPGKLTVRYGGNTNCVTLSLGKKKLFIFDAGCGIKALSNYLLKNNMCPLSAKIFITHPHWDHINGFPYFVPFYMKSNKFEIYGTNHPGASLEQTLCAQMESIYFPVTFREFSAHISYNPITEETFWLNDVCVKTMFLVHPGRCLGYRIDYNNKSFCYVTDNELYPETSRHYNKYDFEKIVAFVSNANVLITDATYTDEEYALRENWGHSPISRVVDMAHQANVNLLCLHHHDPDQTDLDIDRKLQFAQTKLLQIRSKTRCIAPEEGQILIID